jgi:hypothetical protein
MLESGLEAQFVLKIKGLNIFLSFNHQFVQSGQTVWEGLGVNLTELLRSRVWARNAAAPGPHSNLSRE